MERAMKVMQWLATVALVMAGVVLLAMPARAQGVVDVKAAGSVTTGPTRFTVVDEGTVGKPDVVLIPGMSSSRTVWDAEAKLLAPNYRLHLVQVDGFAGEPAGPNAAGVILPAIVEQLHAYIVADKMHPVVIGHSLGGLLTLMLADKYPADVSKMVIVDTLPFYAVLMDPAATVESIKPQVEVIKTQLSAMPADQYAEMQPMVAAQMVKDPEGQKLVAANSGKSDRAVVLEGMVEDLQTDLRADVANIKTPMLLLYPYDATLQGPDPVKVSALYKTAYASKPNVTLVQIDDSRHFIMYDQPGKMDAAVEGFLK
jgi:pimeloyl-ACP methyl ester carboxylesterase